MTSFSSSSTARPTGRLLCSACRLGIVGSRPLASVTRRVLVPPPRTPACPQPQDPGLHCIGAHAPSQGPGPASELCSGQTDGRGPRHALLLLLEAGRLWTSLRHPQGALEPRGSVVPAGGARRTPPGWQTLSPEVCPDSASSQSRGVCHPLPASCPSAACPPIFSRRKDIIGNIGIGKDGGSSGV